MSGRHIHKNKDLNLTSRRPISERKVYSSSEGIGLHGRESTDADAENSRRSEGIT